MVDYAGNGWAALGWDVNPMLIGIALAEIAEIAGDVDSALRWDADPIGVDPNSETWKLRTVSRKERN
jgi:hypothetical protein